MRKIKYLISLSVFSALMIFSVSVNAQTTTATITGTVTDANGAAIAGATVKVTSSSSGSERSVAADSDGTFRIAALPAGLYSVEVSNQGFATKTSNVELLINSTANFNIRLDAAGVSGTVDVTSEPPLMDSTESSAATTITPRQIQDLPVNGREYLDLLQLVPGVAINRQSGGDNANPVLGERSGNNNFYIDGQPNKDTVNGGPAAPFNQETIAEFQVVTTGYKAEFGQASGAIINVITKSGGNGFHGVGSLFHRNDAFDSINSLDTTVTEPPELSRYNYSFAIGGPIINPGFGEGTEFFKPLKDKAFFFASVERITEDRGIDFKFPVIDPIIDQILQAQEGPFDGPELTRGTRAFLKLNQQFKRHQFVEEINWTNEHVIGSGNGLPSTRTNSHSRHLLLGFGDTMLLGDLGNPWIVTLRGGYRDEPSDNRGTVPGVVGATLFVPYSSRILFPQGFPPLTLFGDLPFVSFGRATTPSNTFQKYTSFSASANKLVGNHDFKFGWQFLKTKVDGVVGQNFQTQLFATVDDYINFGPVNSGTFLILEAGAPTPEGNELHLRNNYNGLYIQDDWKILKNLTVNLGVRWDHDSEFGANKNFMPRVGFAWAITPKTIIRGNYGRFYDQFRLGLVSQVPAFGGADRRVQQPIYFPRGFYGMPSAVGSIAALSGLPGPCVSNNLTDAQITAGGFTCPFGLPLTGVDRLNRVVAPGNQPIPANTVINISNVQALTGLTPAQYLTQAAAAIGQPDGYFFWGAFGALGNPVIPAQQQPTSVDSTFKTPHTDGFSVGLQRQLTDDMVIEVDYFHRNIRNILGNRTSNLRFESRVAGIGRSFNAPNTTGEISTFGPFFEGKYDAVIVNFSKRLSNRYLVGANYTWANATDNSLGVNTRPTDQFIGVVPTVVEPCAATNPGCTPQTNANGSFTSRNGNFVAAAGTFLNGPDLDKGPSSLALDHIFQVNGLVTLPWQFQVSGIFRVQSGFRFSRFDTLNRDPDGNGNFNGIDTTAGRNAFTGPAFVNLDMRFSKQFDIGERVKLQVLFEFFNLMNRQNPAAIQNREGVTGEPFGSATQVLPGREGQIGFRVTF